MSIQWRMIKAGVIIGGFVAMAMPASYAATDLATRITESQNAWRMGTSTFWGEAAPHSIDSAKSVEHRIQLILDRLVYVSPLRGYDIRTRIVPDPKINAYTDGKTIAIHTGLIQTFWGEDQPVASVVAHELAHIIANHKAQSRQSIWTSLWQAIRPFLSLHRYASLAGTALGEVSNIKSASYSRFQEKEADAISAILMSEAGFDPHGLSQFMKGSGNTGSGWALPTSIQIPTNFSNPASLSQGLATNVLRASPFYRSHPSSGSRDKTMSLIAETKSGALTLDALRKKDKKLAEIYQTIEMRRPKNRHASI